MTQANDLSTDKQPIGAVVEPPTKVRSLSCLVAILLLVGMIVLGGVGGWLVAAPHKNCFEFCGLTEILSGAGIGLLVGIVAAALWMNRGAQSRRSSK